MRTIALLVAVCALLLAIPPPVAAKVKIGGITISGRIDLGWLAKIGSYAFTAHKASKAIKHVAPSPAPRASATPAPHPT